MIPQFGPGGVLPPFLAQDVVGQTHPRSPYSATMLEFIDRFGTSPERNAILRGLIGFRGELKAAGFQSGIQWINGSFVEDCETIKSRPPGDIDVVSLLRRPADHTDDQAWTALLNAHLHSIFDWNYTKRTYSCDSYFVDLNVEGQLVATQTAYWFGLFSHQRLSFRWKGMVQLNLLCDDEAALASLVTREQGW